MSEPVRKYLAAYAEPEAAAARSIERRWPAAVVVPAYRESVELIEGLRPTLARAGALLILVVNRGADDEQAIAENDGLLAAVRALGRAKEIDAGIELIDGDAFDVLLVDRTCGERAFAGKGGVGAARKIGLDLSLSLWHQGGLASDWLWTTDADVTLPLDYFDAGRRAPPAAGALTLPFHHRLLGSEKQARAVALYEISLRYYVLGLRAARSPYAFQAIGSTIALRPVTYASVRGVPRRQAGEDFYLLGKIAKLGAVHRPDVSPIEIRADREPRTPFGTAVGVKKILEGGEPFCLYAPACFAELGRWLESLAELAATGDSRAIRRVLSGSPLAAGLTGLGIEAGIERACSQARTAAERTARLHRFFDAKLTLRLIHNLRDRAHPSLPWRDALARAPFIGEPLVTALEPTAWRTRLAEEENDGPRDSGIDTHTDQN